MLWLLLFCLPLSTASPSDVPFFPPSATEYTVVCVLGLLSWETVKARFVVTKSMATRRLVCTYCSMGILWSGTVGFKDMIFITVKNKDMFSVWCVCPGGNNNVIYICGTVETISSKGRLQALQ